MADLPAPKLPALPGNIKSWDAAVAAVRGRASWFVAAIAFLALALFGATAIVTRPSLSWEDHRDRLLLAWLLASVGVAGAVLIIYRASAVYLPVVTAYDTLDSLPRGLRDDLRRHPDDYLPDGTTPAEFRGDLRAVRAISARRTRELAQAQARLDEDPDDAARQRDVTSAEHRLYGALTRQQAYEAALRRILERAGYEQVAARRNLPAWVAVVSVVVAVCGIGYQLLLSTAAAPTSGAAPEADADVVATLVRDPQNAANTALWDALGLQRCAPARPGTPDGILVAVRSGRGTTDDPYRVTTLPRTAVAADCPQLTFETVDAVAPVVRVEPAAVVVSYAPATPTPSPRR